MAKVRTTTDNISPIGTFRGTHVTTITEKDGSETKGRGFTREESRQNAEDNYDEKRRGR